MRWLLACVFVLLLPTGLTAQEHPRSILVLDDANAKAPFYYLAYARLRAVVNADTESSPVNLYTESLDLTRFNGPAYEESLQQVFEAKYREKPIGVIVTIGSSMRETACAGGKSAGFSTRTNVWSVLYTW